MASLQITADNAVVVSYQLAQIMTKVNSGSGTLGRFIQDSTIAENINQTIMNLKKSSKGLNENMNAAKENFLFRGYYKRKEKAAEKIKNDSIEKKAEQQKSNEKKK
jgi:phospholipid/cholesterol/gamma-HCH transport system substrate-binding protein